MADARADSSPESTSTIDERLAAQLVAQARSEGLSLIGEGGLLGRLTKMVLESALEGEISDHLGYEAGDAAGRNGGNSRNGHRAKTVLTEIGPVEVEVPRDRQSTFEPRIVRKRQRRLTGIEDLVISLSAKRCDHRRSTGAPCRDLRRRGLTPDDLHHHRQGDRGHGRLAEPPPGPRLPGRLHRRGPRQDPRRAARPAVLRRAGRHRRRGARHPRGCGPATAARAPRCWLHVLTEIKNRGTQDCCILVCDGLTGLPDAVAQVWPAAVVQTCVVHLLRNSFRYAGRKDWPAIAKGLKPVYTAPTEAAALDRLVEFSDQWEARYPAIVKLWENAWAEFTPFLNFDPEIRTVICTTNAIESLNARFRRAVNTRGRFPNEQAALKCRYLVICGLDPTGKGRQRWTNRWKKALNAFDITFDHRLTAAGQ